jgi:hypothetical protein
MFGTAAASAHNRICTEDAVSVVRNTVNSCYQIAIRSPDDCICVPPSGASAFITYGRGKNGRIELTPNEAKAVNRSLR